MKESAVMTQRIEIDDTVSDRINAIDDVDSYLVYLDGPETYYIEVRGTPSDNDLLPTLDLYNANSESVGGDTGHWTSGNHDIDAQITYTVEPDERGDYRIDVSGLNDDIGTYDLFVRIA
jgi:hypothetical protein